MDFFLLLPVWCLNTTTGEEETERCNVRPTVRCWPARKQNPIHTAFDGEGNELLRTQGLTSLRCHSLGPAPKASSAYALQTSHDLPSCCMRVTGNTPVGYRPEGMQNTLNMTDSNTDRLSHARDVSSCWKKERELCCVTSGDI